MLEDETSEVAPLSFDGAVSSLSAIILDDGYYEFIRDNATNVEGITLLDALHIIPLKMRALGYCSTCGFVAAFGSLGANRANEG